MHHHFKTIYTQLQTQRDELLTRVKGIAPEKYNFSPAPGKWSIGQILTHIYTSERLSLQYMKKKVLGIDALKNAGPGEFIRLRLLIFSQQLPFRYRAPKAVVDNTPPVLEIADLEKQWNDLRDELAHFLSNIEEKNVRKLLYKHPVGGRMDAKQAMEFFREHINHHKPQIIRLLNG